jgi:PAS domain S-box-containing protein
MLQEGFPIVTKYKAPFIAIGRTVDIEYQRFYLMHIKRNENMNTDQHYLKKELYALIKEDVSIFEFLQQGSLDGIWYWDLEDHENEWMSPRFWTILGYDPAEKKHLASEWQDLIYPEDLQVALSNFTKHCADPNHPYDQAVRYRHKDGSTVWVRCRGMAIRDNTGKPIRMLGAHTDLTPQKLAEEALRQKTIELEKANKKLQEALDNIRTLKGFIPICSHCKKVRDDKGYWNQIEAYLHHHSDAEFSHGICPECAKKHYPDLAIYDD